MEITEVKKHHYNDGRYAPDIKDLIGRTFTVVAGEKDGDILIFKNDKEVFTFCHDQDCCECVSINDITGSLQDLVGYPILFAEESTSNEPNTGDSCTWTFYKFATIKGWVDIRWLGESNGYYSESVNLRYDRYEN